MQYNLITWPCLQHCDISVTWRPSQHLVTSYDVTWPMWPYTPSPSPQVKESPVPSDTLLTVDLKSGSKIKIGTHTPSVLWGKPEGHEMAGHRQQLVSYVRHEQLLVQSHSQVPRLQDNREPRAKENYDVIVFSFCRHNGAYSTNTTTNSRLFPHCLSET